MSSNNKVTAEELRLENDLKKIEYWRRWGPYLSERQWGTVREDYSEDQNAWNYFTHDQSRFRAYRWGEDGIGGISDNHQRLCFAPAFWNLQDPILKERLFGLNGHEGNHGEDVKEYYFHLDNTPSHSYMHYLYKYPQQAFPYSELVEGNKSRGREEQELELLDLGVFDEDKYFDIEIEYAKAGPEDLLIKINIGNRAGEKAPIYVLPTLWFKNTWSWKDGMEKPSMVLQKKDGQNFQLIRADHSTLGARWLYCEGNPDILFTENETNRKVVFGEKTKAPYTKDAFHDYIIKKKKEAVNPKNTGTKAATVYYLELPPGERTTIRLRLTNEEDFDSPFAEEEFERVFNNRKSEADLFYQKINPTCQDSDLINIQRQAFAGMLWHKQFYHYVVEDWLEDDVSGKKRRAKRNAAWPHFHSDHILSMPDKWEYPWFATWDTAFHTIVFAMIDPAFAKHQLLLLTREWFMHPNGQLPAYEWDFSNVNPPVHAWAAWRIFNIERKQYGRADHKFLERVFQKLLLNFTWWVNRKDSNHNNVFEGGFLGLDNIGIFDRSMEMPLGGHLEQADGTSWMAMFCQNMLTIAIELAKVNAAYEDIASKFFEHFVYIADAMNDMKAGKEWFWNEESGFYYDLIHLPNGNYQALKINSIVGLIPLFAIDTIEPDDLEDLPEFRKRIQWFVDNRSSLINSCTNIDKEGNLDKRILLSIVGKERLRVILKKVLNEERFLSDYGIRSVSKYHKNNPFVFSLNGDEYVLKYEPAESTNDMFGGNSNWRGPIWFPINFLLIETLQKYHYHLGDDFKVEYPTGSNKYLNLWDVSCKLSKRLISIFTRDANGKRPVYGGAEKFQKDEHWRNYILFYEYFHGDNGAGLGAAHQTGWTGLVAKMIKQQAEYR